MYLIDEINSRKNNFDFLRFFAAAMVIFSHSYALTARTFEPYVLLSGYASLGALAVNIFFILSGFLITKSWHDKPDAFEYLKKRALRILPGLFFAIMFTIFIIGPLATTLSLREYFGHPMTKDYFSNVFLSVKFFLPGVFEGNLYPKGVNGSLWTLPVEFKLYVLVMIVGVLGIFRKRLFVLLAGSVLYIYGVMNLLYPKLYNLNETQLDYLRCSIYFFAGILLYLYKDKIKFSRDILLVAIILLMGTFQTKYGAAVSYITLPYIILFFGLMKTESLNIFSKYGDFSYGLYIYAFPVQQLIVYLSKNHISTMLLFGISFILTLLLSILSWHIIEKQFLKLKSANFLMIKQSILQRVYKKFAIGVVNTD